METPRVSIIMLTFSRPQFLSRAIESVQRQTIADWELVVVHDGPNQDIESILRGWETREPRIRYFRRKQFGNIAEATNFGIRQARGRFIAILDDDDYWRVADKLERQIRFLEDNPDYVACGGGAVCVDEEARELMSYLKPKEDPQIKARALLANPMVHSTVLYRRDAAEKIGNYDESLAGFQDWDFFLRLGQTGKLYNFPEHFLAYQIWPGNGSFEAQRRNTASTLRIVRRHGGTYRNYPAALAMAWSYYIYARLPKAVHRFSYSRLTRLKKAMFSHQASNSA